MTSKKSILDFGALGGEVECIETLFDHKNVAIERIVSSGSQPPAKYLQDHDEWVLLVSGEAEMTLDGQPVSLSRVIRCIYRGALNMSAAHIGRGHLVGGACEVS